MIQTRISVLRNKFFVLLGIIVSLSIFFVAFNNFQSNESSLMQKIEKLELQNDAFNKQMEGEHLASSYLPISAIKEIISLPLTSSWETWATPEIGGRAWTLRTHQEGAKPKAEGYEDGARARESGCLASVQLTSTTIQNTQDPTRRPTTTLRKGQEGYWH